MQKFDSEKSAFLSLDEGRYLPLSSLARSTISISFSADKRLFASTHGDHNVNVFHYPSGELNCTLEGHPRTPWAVQFHPSDSDILASGCLGRLVIVWRVSTGSCILKRDMESAVSCLRFTPDGARLAITSGRSLYMWNYAQSTTASNNEDDASLSELLHADSPLHLVDIHPSQPWLVTGVKNRYGHDLTSVFTLRLVVNHFDGQELEPVLELPRVLAYNEAGVDMSPCGSMLAVCVPAEEGDFAIVVMSLTEEQGGNIGRVLFKRSMGKGHREALTTLKFSPTGQHLLAGFSFRPTNLVLRELTDKHKAEGGVGEWPQFPVISIYEVDEELMLIRSLYCDYDGEEVVDEINTAVFTTREGIADGVVYGTQKGRIRLIQAVADSAEPLPI